MGGFGRRNRVGRASAEIGWGLFQWPLQQLSGLENQCFSVWGGKCGFGGGGAQKQYHTLVDGSFRAAGEVDFLGFLKIRGFFGVRNPLLLVIPHAVMSPTAIRQCNGSFCYPEPVFFGGGGTACDARGGGRVERCELCLVNRRITSPFPFSFPPPFPALHSIPPTHYHSFQTNIN